MNRKFINRKMELDFLEKLSREGGSQLAVIYGRRRVGKTALITKFAENKPHIYFLADKRGTARNADRFALKAAAFFNDVKPETDNFDKAFEYMAKRVKGKGFVVIIDEFSYLVERDPAIPSVFQLIADEILPTANIYLILCGSIISMMHKGALSYKSPLYGRRTGEWKLSPLKFGSVAEFVPGWSMEKAIEAFSVFGNMPAYLARIDENLDILGNIEEKILEKGSVLYNEPEILLREELRDPSTYLSILEAMSTKRKLTEIANKAGMPAKDIPKYLRVLQKIEIVDKMTRVTEKKSKKTLYRIKDEFFDFWFKFVLPNKSELEEGKKEDVMNVIKRDFNRHVSFAFEEVCKEFLQELNSSKKLGSDFSRIGKWWGAYRDKESHERKTAEIDIVAVSEQTREILFAECKWQDDVNPQKVLGELMEKARLVDWNTGKRKEHHAIFAKSFSRRDVPEGVMLFDLKDMEKVFRKSQSA